MGLLEKLKKNRNRTIDALKNATNDSAAYKNDDEYFPERDSEGNASVVIRFLPQQDPDKVPFVSYYKHIFKGDDGKWLVTDLCATTLGQNCEICQKNSKLFQSGIAENQNIARSRKRKKEYAANILVIKDPKSPEKEGKVFVFKFGATIYEKIKSALNPKYEDEEVLNPFDLWEGADFYLRIRRDSIKKQITYEDSKFGKQSALFDGDESKLEALLEQCHDLGKYINPENVKSGPNWTARVNDAYQRCMPDSTAVMNQYEEKHSAGIKQAPVKNEPEFPQSNVRPSESINTDEDPLAAFKAMVEEVPF